MADHEAGAVRSKVVVSALIRDADKYLFIRQHQADGAYPGTLHLPGGHIEDGENPDEAIKREIAEEVGVTVTNLEPFDFDWDLIPYKGGMVRFVFLRFTADLLDGTPQPSSDAAEIVWLDESELELQGHNPPSLRMLGRLRHSGHFADLGR